MSRIILPTTWTSPQDALDQLEEALRQMKIAQIRDAFRDQPNTRLMHLFNLGCRGSELR